MTLASSRRRSIASIGCALVATAIVASTSEARADPPPSDLPPVPLKPATAPPGPPAPLPWAPPPSPSPSRSRVAPATGVTPGHVLTPPGFSPAEIPPGYAAPGPAYPQPGYYYPYPQAPTIDPYTLPPPLPRRHKSEGLYVGGIVAVSTGMAAVLLGSYFVASAVGRIDIYCDMPSVPCAFKNDAPRMTGGAILMAAGALAGALGIPMWVLGGQYVVIPKGDDAPKSALVPEVHVGPFGASATLRF